ncbi:unnamed protein product [Polarella glacialis]|uniref:Uncharacterized protein n=1 Tax=Polarella glacialis TaxID=89957 RepID=A0A813IHI9_POLGL|nr:unnamed protein product [Polarella glacialis]
MEPLSVSCFLSEDGHKTVAVRCEDEKHMLASCSADICQCIRDNLLQDIQEEDIQSDRLPELSKGCSLLTGSCARLVHIVGGDESRFAGVAAVGVGSNLKKRTRAIRLAIALRAAMMQNHAEIEQKVTRHSWGQAFLRLLHEALSSFSTVESPIWGDVRGDMGYFTLAEEGEESIQSEALHVEYGELRKGKTQSEWHSAMWSKADLGDGFFWLVNRWLQKDNARFVLHTNSGRLDASLADRSKYPAMWRQVGIIGGCVLAVNRSSPAIRVVLRPLHEPATFFPASNRAGAIPSTPSTNDTESQNRAGAIPPTPSTNDTESHGRSPATKDTEIHERPYSPATGSTVVNVRPKLVHSNDFDTSCLRPLTQCERWQAWLQCQPDMQHLHLHRRHPPAKWACWHEDYWQRLLDRRPPDASHQEWTAKEWARWERSHGIEVTARQNQVTLSPFEVLFTQGSISSVFGGGKHQGVSIDSTIKDILDGKINPKDFPQLDVFEADGRLYSINNRRLFVWRVLACMGFWESITVTVHQRDSPLMAPKWAGQFDSKSGHLTVLIRGETGSRYADCQARAPCEEWRQFPC